MQKVTAWSRKVARESKTHHPSYFIYRFEHNHIEDGWVQGLKPRPKFDSQKSWLNSYWKKHYCYITPNQVVIPGV